MEVKDLQDYFIALLKTYADKTGSAYTASGTADSGTMYTLVDNALTQDNDYWNHAVLTITDGTNSGKSRVAWDFDATTDTVHVRAAFPNPIDATSVYTLSFLPLAGTRVLEGPMLAVGSADKIVEVRINNSNPDEPLTIGLRPGARRESVTLSLHSSVIWRYEIDDSASEIAAKHDEVLNLDEQVKSIIRMTPAIDEQTKHVRIQGTTRFLGTYPNQENITRLFCVTDVLVLTQV